MVNGRSPLDHADELAALQHSVVGERANDDPVAGGAIFPLWFAAQYDLGIPAWGTDIKIRDRMLREFITHEPLFNAALGIVSARNAALNWDLTGTKPRLVEAAHRMLNSVNFGGGWEEMIGQTTIDLATQDSGAFLELVRTSDSPTAPVVEINHLDAARCWSTGVPHTPVIYQDTKGAWHEMKWYQVVQLLEVPAPATPMWGGFFWKLQYSTLTRLLRLARIMESVWTYRDEKISGRFTRSLHLVQGIGMKQIDDALTKAQAMNDSEGLRRFAPPALIAALDPGQRVDAKTLDFVSLGDGYNESESIKNYILALAMAFMTDYQEFAPLPGGNLGTSEQSEILDKKSRGKGPALFQRIVTRVMNMNGVLPTSVQFAFLERDPDQAREDAESAKTRAEERQIRLAAGEIDVTVARERALDAGDLTKIEFDQLVSAPPVTDEVVAAGADQATGDALETEVALGGEQRSDVDGPQGQKAAAEMVALGPLLSGRLHRAYATTADDLTSQGYFTSTDERIKVAAAIGPALALFEDALRDEGLWDLSISAEDADRIVAGTGLKVLGGIDPNTIDPAELPGVGDEDERLAIEADVADAVEQALGRMRRATRRRLAELDAQES